MARDNMQLDYDEQVRLYSEAMIRVGEFEAMVAELTTRLSTQVDVPAPGGQGTSVSTSDELQALAGKIDTLGQCMTDSGERSPDPGSQPGVELRELRLQTTNMAKQLAVAQDELATLRGSRRRRRRKTLPALSWRALGHLLGFRPPHSS